MTAANETDLRSAFSTVPKDMAMAKRNSKETMNLPDFIPETVEAFAAVADKQRRLLEKVITSTRDHFYLLNGDGKFIYANTSLLNDLNINNSALMGMTHLDLHFPGSDMLYQEAMKVIATGEERRGEITYSLPSGGERDYEYAYEPILGDQKMVEGVAALERDITERKQAKEALRKSEEKFRALFDKGPIGVAFHKMVYDNSGKAIDYRFLDANSSYLELTGVDPRGKCATEAFPGIEKDPFDWIGTFGRVAKTGEQIRFEQYLHANKRWYDCVGYQVEPDYFVTAFVEITERKQAEEELKAANKELEAFSYSVSHDLRSPLRTISGFISLLSEHAGPLDGKTNEYLQRIEAGAAKMDRLIDDLLSLSRISRLEMVIQEIALSAMARVVVRELELQHPERHVEKNIANDLKARGDSRLIKIALTNLIGNAWKYTDKTVEARVEFGSCRKNGKEVFFVRDNGAGFSMDQVYRLFQPFQRLHSESEFTGMGIGLPIVHRVISRHGGEIWGEGEVGKGATFYFTLGS